MTSLSERRSKRRRSFDEVATAPGWRGAVECWAERGVFYLLCLMLVSAPLAFGAVRPWSRGPLELMGLLALLCWAVRVAAAGRLRWVRTPLDLPLAVGVLYVVWRYAASPVEWISRQEMLLVLLYAGTYFLVTQHCYRRARQNALLWVLVVTAVLIAAYGMVCGLRGAEMTWWLVNKDYPGRAFGTFYCPNHFSGYLEIVLAVAAAHLLWSGRAAAQRIVLAYAACVMLGGIVLSLSRGGYLSAGGMLMFLAVFVMRGVTRRWWPGVVLAALMAWAGVIGVQSFGSLQKRFSLMQAGAGEPSRTLMWQAALRMWQDYPWLGAGPFLYDTVYGKYRDPQDQYAPEHTHNDYLQSLTDYGLVGFGLMGALVGTFWVSAWRIHRRWRELGRDEEPRWHWPYWLEVDRSGRPGWLLGSMGAVLAIMLHSVVDFNLHITANALTLTVIMAMGMLAGYTRHLSDDLPPEAATLPPVIKPVELGPLSRVALAGLIVLLVAAEAMIVVPNYGAYLYQRLAEKQRLPAHYEPAWPRDETREVMGIPACTVAPDFQAACANAERAWRLDPRSYQVARLLGDLRLNEARLAARGGNELGEEALRWYRLAETLNPFDGESIVRQSNALEFLRRWDEAEVALRRAVDLEPNLYTYHLRLGRFYATHRKKAEAIAALQLTQQLLGKGGLPPNLFATRKLDELTASGESKR